VLRHHDWLKQPERASTMTMAQHSRTLTALISDEFRGATRDEWGARPDAEGVIWAPVSTVLESALREQAVSQQTLQHVQFRRRFLPVVRSPFVIEGAEIRARGPGPLLGEHNEAVLLAAGCSLAEIAGLAMRGAFGA
jgi:crotonobetainyl-CoA:carnitine CoA-transferase CaiB-like acyl-CoA transferase